MFEREADDGDSPFVSDNEQLNTNDSASSRPLGTQRSPTDHNDIHTSAFAADSGGDTRETIAAAQSNGAEVMQHGETASVPAGAVMFHLGYNLMSLLYKIFNRIQIAFSAMKLKHSGKKC